MQVPVMLGQQQANSCRIKEGNIYNCVCVYICILFYFWKPKGLPFQLKTVLGKRKDHHDASFRKSD